MPDDSPLLAITTLPDAATARALAETLVGAGLAACINISAPVTSVYRWQGEITTDDEVMLTIKTTAAAYPALESRLRADHPYELPELIAVPITRGLPTYIDWIRQCVQR